MHDVILSFMFKNVVWGLINKDAHIHINQYITGHDKQSNFSDCTCMHIMYIVRKYFHYELCKVESRTKQSYINLKVFLLFYF